MAGWDTQGIGYWAAEQDGAPVGVAGIRPLVLDGLEGWNLYYRFAPGAWRLGQGLAAEAAREAVAYGHELAPGRPVLARTRPSNRAAIRVAEKVGLVRREDLDHEGYLVFASASAAERGPRAAPPRPAPEP